MHFASLPVPTEELPAAELATLATTREAKAEVASAVADVSIESVDTEILSEEDEVDSRQLPSKAFKSIRVVIVTSLGRSATRIDDYIEGPSPICEDPLTQVEPPTTTCQGEPSQLVLEGHPVTGPGSFLKLLLEEDLQKQTSRVDLNEIKE